MSKPRIHFVWTDEAALRERFQGLLRAHGTRSLRDLGVGHHSKEILISERYGHWLQRTARDAPAEARAEDLNRSCTYLQTKVDRWLAGWRSLDWNDVLLVDVQFLDWVVDDGVEMQVGTAFAANLGNYECTQALNPGWPSAPGVVFPPALGGATVTCMCVCFLSFPAPGHALVADVLLRGLDAFRARGHVYGGFGAWVFMDALRDAVPEPGFDARPISTTEILCWPQVLNATVPQSDAAVAAIMRECKAVHMMGGAHAKKFGSDVIEDDTLFGQVYGRIEGALGTCAG
jgi:hypothetical protein